MKPDYIKYYIIVFVILIIFTYFMGNRAGKLKFNSEIKDDKQKEKDYENIGVTESEINKSNLTFDKSIYYNFANTIEGSFGITDDEQAIYNVFRKLKTIDDVKMLLLVYGKRRIIITPTPFTPIWRWLTPYSLIEAFELKLDKNEIGIINSILQKKGIDFNF